METTLIISSILLWLIVCFQMLLLVGLIRKVNQGRKPAEIALGQKAPDFKALTLLGETVGRVDHVGQKVAYIFIGTHCEPCRAVLPEIEALQARAKRAGVQLVLVSGDEDDETKGLASDLHLTLPVLMAPKRENTFFDDYHVNLTPSYCLVDEEGVVQSAGIFALKGGNWEKIVASWPLVDTVMVGREAS